MHLTEKEYHMYLLTLRLNEEIELLKKCLILNQEIYPIDDNFDLWVRSKFSELEPEKSGRGSIILDDQYLILMLKTVHYITRHSKGIKEVLESDYNAFAIDSYLDKIKPQRLNLFYERKRDVLILTYEIGSVLRTGDIFGSYNVEIIGQDRR